jgi:hypothetical protein
MGGATGKLRGLPGRQRLLVTVLVAMLVGAVAAIVVLAIGDDSDRPVAGSPGEGTSQTSPGPFVTQEDLAALEDGSPGRAVLRWWQLLQFQAPVSEIHSYYARSADVTVPTLRRQLTRLGYLFPEGKPRVVQVDESDSSATVLTVITRRPVSQSGDRQPAQHLPQYFKLAREGSRWKLADNSYLNRLIAAEVAAQREQEQR